MNIIDSLNIGITTKFIAPMIFKDNVSFTDLPITNYQTYLSIFDKPEYDDKIIIDSNLSSIDISLCKPGLFIKRIKEEHALLNIFHIPKEYEDDLYDILSGRYKELTNSYKQKLLYFWKEDKDSKLFGLLFDKIELRFSENEYLLNKKRIERARSLYSKPTYIELIYGLTY
jgi:hypothetical protein